MPRKYLKSYKIDEIFLILFIVLSALYAFYDIFLGSKNLLEKQINVIILGIICLFSLSYVSFLVYTRDAHITLLSAVNKQYPYVTFAKNIKNSEFEFINMARTATSSIFVVGPNLNFIANEKNGEIKELLFKKMNDNKQFEVKMLLSNPKQKGICEAISKSTFTESFENELKDAVASLSDWKHEADTNGIGSRFNVRKADIITLSLVFIDENTSNASVLVTPIPVNIESRARSCFFIQKHMHADVFDKYYNAYLDFFHSIKTKDIDEL
ncbi:hypothetical protein [uncultured Methanolobus sp.]|uniref:hypothetical protein n=1 Tax=uncultured Methanolobus sp. TaxID=218300 RepID=UPI002AABFB86|nr:hypothetical protein [uncultured Methanolobus sp.]